MGCGLFGNCGMKNVRAVLTYDHPSASQASETVFHKTAAVTCFTRELKIDLKRFLGGGATVGGGRGGRGCHGGRGSYVGSFGFVAVLKACFSAFGEFTAFSGILELSIPRT